jgi:hypothetical protein
MTKVCGTLFVALALGVGMTTSSFAAGPRLEPNISYGSCNASCGRPAVWMLSSSNGRAAVMGIQDGCNVQYNDARFGKVRIARSGKFHASRVLPHIGLDPNNPGNLLDVTQTIRGRVRSPRKIVGTATQSDAVCSISFRFVARPI